MSTTETVITVTISMEGTPFGYDSEDPTCYVEDSTRDGLSLKVSSVEDAVRQLNDLGLTLSGPWVPKIFDGGLEVTATLIRH